MFRAKIDFLALAETSEVGGKDWGDAAVKRDIAASFKAVIGDSPAHANQGYSTLEPSPVKARKIIFEPIIYPIMLP